jgi:UDP-N-acetylmuramoyl-L-alanyl-D-glutamate--2,6-diaminopimelate ligase
MKKLEYLIRKLKTFEIIGNTDVLINDVCFNSGEVIQNSLFVAVKGTRTDAHQFIPQAIQKGAVAIICEDIPELISDNICFVKVKDSSLALGIVASEFYDNPSIQLKLVGVTGTNGKTTIATLLHQMVMDMGFSAGLLSTICVKINSRILPATHTTPDPLAINKMLREMSDNGITHVFMEVSSHAVHQNRIAGLHFTGGIFTNITHDHLDYHKTFAAYLKAKKMFFDYLPSSAFALANIDDRNGEVMIQNTKAKKFTYSLQSMADFKTKVLESRIDGTLLNISGNEVWCKLVGKFNAYNLTAIYAAAVLLDFDPLQVLAEISNLNPAEGRFDCIRNNKDVVAIVDYAHTPDALKNVLQTINELRTGNEKIITVVGAGGDRDRTKRPEMAEVSAELSDKVILTSDNPRSEEPEAIIQEMEKGIGAQHRRKVLSITDRKEAIKTAYALANKGDIILIAGKGHEKYQEIKGNKFPFDDKKIIIELMQD